MSIAENIKRYQSSLPSGVKLIAVSKTKPVEDLQQAYEAGQRLFGENKALEMRDKHEVLPKDIHWHFIGHLQTNKVKYIVPFVSMIHSVDSLKVLKEINKEAIKCNRVVDCCCIAMYMAQFIWRFQQVSTCCSVECDLLLRWLYASSEKSDKKNFEKTSRKSLVE